VSLDLVRYRRGGLLNILQDGKTPFFEFPPIDLLAPNRFVEIYMGASHFQSALFHFEL